MNDEEEKVYNLMNIVHIGEDDGSIIRIQNHGSMIEQFDDQELLEKNIQTTLHTLAYLIRTAEDVDKSKRGKIMSQCVDNLNEIYVTTDFKYDSN